MNKQETLDQMQQLRLQGMELSYKGILSLPIQNQPGAHELIARLVESEIQYRADQKTKKYLQNSKLRYDAVLEEVHCNQARNLTKENLMYLADCQYIERAENILITGATGCGKSFLTCALGRQACLMGYKVMYFGMNRFIEKIAQSKIDGTYLKVLNQLEKIHLIIFDDFGLYPLDNINKLALLQILEDRYGKMSTVIASQLPVSKWYDYMGEPTITDAIMDRLSSCSNKIELKGESLRKKEIKKIN